MSPCKPSGRRAPDAADSNDQRLIREELEKIFNWNPPLYRGRGSHSTRAPAFFDQHLDDRLILKRVIHLPTLAADMAGAVDKYLWARRVLPSFPKSFTSRRKMDGKSKEAAGEDVISEDQVETNFLDLQGTLTSIASELAFGNGWDKDARCLSWKGRLEGENCAVPDAYLSLHAPKDQTPPGIGPKTIEVLNAISTTFPTAGIVEFKGLNAGKKCHLEGIIMLSKDAGSFPWVKCDGPHNCPGHYGASGRPVATGAPMGYDSTDSVCQAPLEIKDDIISTDRNSTSKKRKRGEKPEKLTHSIHITQQVYAELVRHDATFAILHSGNWEMIFKRCREEAILYVSCVIEPSKYPGYGKLEIGIILEMFRDARIRANRIKQAAEEHTLPKTWTQYSFEKKANATPKKQRTEAEKQIIQQNLMNHAHKCAFALVTIKPGNLFRSGVVGMFKRTGLLAVNAPDRSAHVSIDFGAEIPGSGMVFDAKLHFNKDKLDVPMIVKWARTEMACASLAMEFDNYLFLQSRAASEALPVFVGHFTPDTTEGMQGSHNAFLVLVNYGISLDRRGGEITLQDRMDCIRCLHRMHSAGYLHGNLKAGNLLSGPTGIRVCGLRNVEESKSSTARIEECLELAEVLNDLQLDHLEARDSDEAAKRRRNDLHSATTAVLLGPMPSETLSQLMRKNPVKEPSGIEWARKTFHEIGSEVTAHDPDLLYIETIATTQLCWWGDFMKEFLPDIPYHCFRLSFNE